MTENELRIAAKHLSQTGRGRSAMRHVLAWLDDDGISLDSPNRNAITVLLLGAWGPFPATARDVMRESIGPLDLHHNQNDRNGFDG